MIKFSLAICLATWAIYLAWVPKERALVDAQAWNVSQVYTPMSFDVNLYGSFNLSQCSRDMINCWQYFPHPTVVCHNHIQFDSVCGLMRNYCTDTHPLINVPEYSNITDNNYQDEYFRDTFDISSEVCPILWQGYEYS